MSRRGGFDVGVPVALPALNRTSSLYQFGGVTALGAVAGTTVTADVNAHTYGAWTEIVAATAAEYRALTLGAPVGANGANTASIVSIGTGGAGAEVELFAVAVGGHNTLANGGIPPIHVPVRIPAGTRIAARLQSLVTAGKTTSLTMGGVPSQSLGTPSTKVDTIGVDTTTSRGVGLAASPNWTQITAATARPYRALVFVPSIATSGAGNLSWTFTVGIGAAGAEVGIASVLALTTTNELIGTTPSSPLVPIYRHIPAGTRIAVRHDQAQTYADATILGIPY